MSSGSNSLHIGVNTLGWGLVIIVCAALDIGIGVLKLTRATTTTASIQKAVTRTLATHDDN